MSKLEDLLLMHLKVIGIQHPEQEYRFAAHQVGMGRGIRDRLLRAGLRDWRFDLCWPDLMLAVEVEGIVWSGKGGRHQRGEGFEMDLDKYHHAQQFGWTIYRCGSALIKSGEAATLIESMINLTIVNDKIKVSR